MREKGVWWNFYLSFSLKQSSFRPLSRLGIPEREWEERLAKAELRGVVERNHSALSLHSSPTHTKPSSVHERKPLPFLCGYPPKDKDSGRESFFLKRSEIPDRAGASGVIVRKPPARSWIIQLTNTLKVGNCDSCRYHLKKASFVNSELTNKQSMSNVVATPNKDQIPVNQLCGNQNITVTGTSELHRKASFVKMMG